MSATVDAPSPPRSEQPRRRRLALAYTPASGRDLRFDFLRGFAVFAMVVDHLAGASKLYLLTGGNRFYTSAAEAFVFISGVIVGLVYRRIAERDGLGTALYRLLARAWSLYVLAVGLTLLVLTVSEMLALPWAQGIDRGNPAAVVWSIVTLHQTYYLVDVPVLYALLLAVAPAGLMLMQRGQTWVVVLVSWLIWAGYQVFPERTTFPWEIAGNYLFQFPAWQVLFFTGMAIGHHRRRVASAFSRRTQRALLVLTGLGFVGLVVLYTNFPLVVEALQTQFRPIPLGGLSFSADLEETLFAKGNVAFGRIVASAIVFAFFFLFATEFWHLLRRALGWLFLPLGQNALYAYSAHVVIAVAVGAFAVLTGFELTGSSEANAVVQIAGLALLWLAIRFRILFPTDETRRAWMVSTVPLALAVLVLFRLDPYPDFPGLEAPPTYAALPAPAVAGPVRANRFGTPIPREQPVAGAPAPVAAPRRANAFGTPIPVPGAAPAFVPPVVTPAPLPEPAPEVQMPMAAGVPRVSEYVGDLHGTFREATFYSAALDREMDYFIYLPPDYGTEGRRYPVLYMLHGASQDKEEWAAYGLIDAADSLIQAKELQPLIIVLPQGDFGYWVNWADEGERWGDYVARDLVRQVDSTYRTLRRPEYRAVGGLSMGAHGALQLGFTRPNVFRSIGAHSPVMRAEGDEETDWILGTGPEFARRDPLTLAATAPNLDRLDIWIDIGEDDPWIDGAVAIHETLEARGVDHAFNILPGDHDGDYWSRYVALYLRYYDQVLHRRNAG